MSISCPKCGGAAEKVGANRYECPYCGESFTSAEQTAAYSGANQYSEYQAASYRRETQGGAIPAAAASVNNVISDVQTGSKSKTVAIILAFFLGGLGIHKMYLGRWTAGILYLVFCWTYIPALLALIDFIVLLTMSDEKFNEKYNTPNA